jgi:hypothetical protein
VGPPLSFRPTWQAQQMLIQKYTALHYFSLGFKMPKKNYPKVFKKIFWFKSQVRDHYYNTLQIVLHLYNSSVIFSHVHSHLRILAVHAFTEGLFLFLPNGVWPKSLATK